MVIISDSYNRHILGNSLVHHWDISSMDWYAPAALLRIHRNVRDGGRGVVLAEEQLARIVRQRDSLIGHLKVHLRWDRQRTLGEQDRNRFTDRFRSRQRLGFYGTQEHDIACGSLLEELPLLSHLRVVLNIKQLVQIPIWDQQTTGQSQRCDRVLIHQGRQRGEDRLIRATLQSNATGCWLNQEVTHQFITSRDLKHNLTVS